MSNFKFALFACAIIALTACSSEITSEDASTATTIEQDILNPDGTRIGTLILKDLGMGGTAVTVSVEGISAGPHAMHFHETGLCEGPDFKSSGGHYNPDNRAHGKNMADGPHAGDMMNIDVSEDMTGEMTIVNDRVSLYGDHNLPAIFDEDGTALIIHAGPDDYESQPSGAAGSRIGCAVLKS